MSGQLALDFSAPPPAPLLFRPDSSYATAAIPTTYDHGAVDYSSAHGGFQGPRDLYGVGEGHVVDQRTAPCSSSCCSSHAAVDDADWVDVDEDNEDVPVAESSKDAAKRATKTRVRPKSPANDIPSGKGRFAAIARRTASGKKPKSSGSRVQENNEVTDTAPPPTPKLLDVLVPIINGWTPCPFCGKDIRTKPRAGSTTGVPGVTCCRDHFFGYGKNGKLQCWVLARWGMVRNGPQDPEALNFVGTQIVQQWPDEVEGREEEDWFPYPMWGDTFYELLIGWWGSLTPQKREKILAGKRKVGDEAKDE